MNDKIINTKNSSLHIANKLRDYLKLIKVSLSIMVVFSGVICFLLAENVHLNYVYPYRMAWLFALAGLLVTASANAINQAVEKETDAMMKRTATRPVAAGRMSSAEAYLFAGITGVAGLFLMSYYFNWTAAGVSAFSLFLYAFIYTPLKKVNAIAVLIGAFPGALPCLIGWTAGEGSLSLGGWLLFGLQFLWQFPHFWAIAWIAHNDYTKAGFKLLPSEKGPTKFTALQTVVYSMLLIPVGLLPYYTGMSGLVSLIVIALANLFMLWRSISLYRNMDVASARKVMFGSYIYLPVVLLALLFDKI